ncbi:MAG TPA: efflux RND transporter permease subunit [Ignavibacteria bacterium]|nr:efflux RND transporter permease subunit [Ignavibacteria bacterium]HRF66408.1 efflux RND transporter permease subunit [Ignavibacteria bacterium]
MSLSATSIRRPVLSIVFSLIIIIFGIVAFTFLEVREYPSVDPPIVTVTTGYPGANSEVIETQITEPLEESLNGIDGIKSLTSQSREGQSQITIEFSLERNLEDASNDVRDRVSRALRNLPTDVDPPVVQKSDADDSPIIFMYVQSNTRNILEVNAFATNVIKERIQTIPGVSTVRIFGERKYAMRMWLDPEKLAAYQLTPLDVRTALEKENVELPSGRIEGDKTELTIRTLGRLKDAEEFNNLIVRETNGTVIRFKDVGYAELGPENERGSLKRAGLLGVGVAVTMQPGGNAIDISDEFKKRYEQLKKDIPADYSIEIGFDFSEYIRTTISEVEETIFIAFGLVILIIFLFLRDWRSTLIPIVAIPTSIISAFFIMYLMGYSINVLTLVGMILAIGLVVDDAIVVLENIYSKIEEGMNPIEAAYKGSKEIYFAVISITIALVAVFLPIMFIEGTTGKLFKEFAVVIAGSVLVSAFVALTLTPMMSSRLLKANAKHNKFYSLTEPFFVKTIDTYRKMLIGFMKIRWAAFIIIAIVGVLIYMTGSSLKSELAPLEDRSNIRIQATAPEGATFEYMQKYMDDLSDVVITSTPEIQTPITNVGAGGQVNNGFINMYLVPPGERERTQQQIYDKLAKEINQISGIRAFPSQPPTIGGRFGGQPIQFVLQAPEYEKLEEFMPKFLEEANKQPELTFVDANLKINKPEINLTIDRQKASDLGVSFSDVASTLQISFGSQRFGYFIKEGKQYQVLGQVTRDKRDNPYDLRYLYVRNKNNQLIQLDNLVSLTEQAAPTTRYRYNRYSSATISGGLAPGYTLGDGIAAMRRVAAEVLPEEFNTALAGQSKDFEESSSSLLFTFVFALIIIYLVLAAQFESFIDPFIILLTVPLALFGALLSLWVFGMTLNIFSQIGIIMLIGLVTKNAILIVEFANQKKEEGLSVKEAVDEAAVQRFRPIMMTSIASALGALPIAIGIGAGSRVSLGIAIVGGLIFSTFLTLFIVPAIYTYLSRHKAANPDLKKYKETDDDEERNLALENPA